MSLDFTICPYCSNPGKLVTGATIYPNNPEVKNRNYYQCVPCNAYVGTRKGTTEPFGYMANEDLRQDRWRTKRMFDRLWKPKSPQRVFDGYARAHDWMAEALKIPRPQANVNQLSHNQCARLRELCINDPPEAMLKLIAEVVTCPYCKNKAEKVTGADLYPRVPGIRNRVYYVCRPCDASVGTHKETGLPFGTLANAELRKWRKNAHQWFDRLWLGHNTRFSDRSEAYKWLAQQLNVSTDRCHIGMFNIKRCKQVVRICSKGSVKVPE